MTTHTATPFDHATRAEDLAWLAETGENADGAAARLGTTVAAIEKWCRNNAPDTWAVLAARQPRDHNQHTGRKNQWSAA